LFQKACAPELRRRYQSATQMHEELLLLKAGKSIKRVHGIERRLPRAVCFCLELALAAIRAISGPALRPEMAIGRVFSELAFTELIVLDSSTELLLGRVIRGLVDAADEIAAGYFTTRVIPPGPYAQQMQQQQ